MLSVAVGRERVSKPRSLRSAMGAVALVALAGCGTGNSGIGDLNGPVTVLPDGGVAPSLDSGLLPDGAPIPQDTVDPPGPDADPPADVRPPDDVGPTDVGPPDVSPPDAGPDDVMIVEDTGPDTRPRREINCTDGRDNDFDGLFDCEDPDCDGRPGCIPEVLSEDCNNGMDDDGDGRVDCDDDDCAGADVCAVGPTTETNCTDNRDNDGDGLIDCRDPDCARATACQPPPSGEICDNGRDDDGDGRADCNDRDCIDHPSCNETCDNGVDDDRDGRIDCQDPDCWGSPLCPEDCTNGVDDDGDAFIDCGDSDCFSHAACIRAEICNNGRDDDRDGLVDCADPDCATFPACIGATAEICNNGLDDDRDGTFDCGDSDCATSEACRRRGNCENDADEDRLDDIDYTAVLSQCGLPCLSVSNQRTCIRDCVNRETGLSLACSDCVGGAGVCALQRCLGSCASNPGSSACITCISTQCGPGFETCSGAELDF